MPWSIRPGGAIVIGGVTRAAQTVLAKALRRRVEVDTRRPRTPVPLERSRPGMPRRRILLGLCLLVPLATVVSACSGELSAFEPLPPAKTQPGAPSLPIFAPPPFTPSRTIVVRTRHGFDAAWARLRPGDSLEVRGVVFTGKVVLHKSLSAPAEVRFDPDVRFVGAPAGTQLPAVWVHDSANIRLFGGDITGAGDAGIRFDGDSDVLWWDFDVHDTAGTGILVHGTESGLDLRGTVTNCGLDLSLDPHAQKGTGNHGVNLSGDGGTIANSRFVFAVHDQPYGAAVEVQGVQNSKLYLDARRITFNVDTEPPGPDGVRQVAGNAVQIWGEGTTNLEIPYLYAEDLAGRAVDVGSGLDSSNGGIVVDYARTVRARLRPVYQPSQAIDYRDVG